MLSEFTHHAVILIPAEFRDAANGAILQVDSHAGDTFVESRGASLTGEAPATVLFAAIQMRDLHFTLCQQLAAAQFPGSVVLDATSETALPVLAAALAERGLLRVEATEEAEP